MENNNPTQPARGGLLSFLKTHKKAITLLVGLAISAYFLWASTRQVVLKDFLSELKNFHAWWLVPSLVVFYFSMYLRAVRWGLLFEPHHKIKGYQAFPPLMVGFGFNCILPRVGEVARAVVVGTRYKTGIPTALATVVAERIIDAATLMGLLAFSLMTLPPFDEKMKVEIWNSSVTGAQFNFYKMAIIKLSIFLVVGVIVFMIPLTQRLLHQIIRALPIRPAVLGCARGAALVLPLAGVRRIMSGMSEKFNPQAEERVKHVLGNTLNHFAQGFHALQQPWVLVQILAHSIVLWILIGWSNQFVAKGFGIPMSLAQAEAQMVMIGIFIMIPAAPGYWGLYEAGAIFGLLLFGNITEDQKSLALAYALVIHLVQYLPIIAMGLFFSWRLQVRPTSAEAVLAPKHGHLAVEAPPTAVK